MVRICRPVFDLPGLFGNNANVLLSVRFASSSECSHPCDSAAPCAAAMLSTKSASVSCDAE